MAPAPERPPSLAPFPRRCPPARRCCSSTTARFEVANLSAAGALLIGSSELGRGDLATLRLEAPGCDPVVVHARILRGGEGDGVNALAVEFRHRSPDTEDAIQDVVLSALEDDARSHATLVETSDAIVDEV